MASKHTEDVRNRAQGLASNLRFIGAEFAMKLGPIERETLEIAALLLEQTSAARIKKAIHAFNEAHGRFLRRQKVGQ